MNELSNMGLPARGGTRSGGGWVFCAGLLVGLAAAIGALALAVATERRRRQRATGAGTEPTVAAHTGTVETADWQAESRELDEELAQTFPASDPLPASHRVD
jgi:hypothetical protein